jgi:hypothetical protein
MGTIDKALQRRKAINEKNITHRAIFNPEVKKDEQPQRKQEKRVQNGIRNKKSR